MELRLDQEETAELQQLLSGALSELSPEIANTDNADYRRTLRTRRERLEAILRQLGGEHHEPGG